MTGGEPSDYLAVAFLRDGRFRCVAAALAVLNATGYVEAGHPGAVRHSEAVTPPADELERVIWRAVHEHVAPGALAARGPVDAALTQLRGRLRREGLIRPALPVRWWLPARTRRGDRVLAAAMERCPWPVVVASSDVSVREAIGLPVALYGRAALVQLLPGFARNSGVLARSSSDTGPGEQYSPPDRSGGYMPGM